MSTSSGEREDRHDGQVIRASQDGGQNGGQDGDQGGGQNGGQEGEERQGDLATERERKVDKPRRYKVLLHNDDYTTMDFVVLVLMKFFHRTETEATHIMLSVHHRGHGVAGVYTRDVAETKVAQVTDHAKKHGMPLRLTAEPE